MLFGIFWSERRDETAVGHFFVFRNFGGMYIKNIVCAFGHSIANPLGKFSEVVSQDLVSICVHPVLVGGGGTHTPIQLLGLLTIFLRADTYWRRSHRR